ncbi:hypothetical protein D5018_10820 [Parashewanella curva]|uniref:Uncharacterized protein n=1 Tax=Parashewanella curva TaxID=2338552 RepID=A0A3L8PWE8_9GAMM|nr:hypothetical protein [Parashewanella curva]RLV59640.1 hypothetical protein D5018_10820 [Parashewanella curva]
MAKPIEVIEVTVWYSYQASFPQKIDAGNLLYIKELLRKDKNWVLIKFKVNPVGGAKKSKNLNFQVGIFHEKGKFEKLDYAPQKITHQFNITDEFLRMLNAKRR